MLRSGRPSFDPSMAQGSGMLPAGDPLPARTASIQAAERTPSPELHDAFEGAFLDQPLTSMQFGPVSNSASTFSGRRLMSMQVEHGHKKAPPGGNPS